MGGNQLNYEKPMNNQWKTMNTNKKQWTTIVLKVYGKPKPAKIWKTNEQSMKTNEHQWKPIVFKGLWEA